MYGKASGAGISLKIIRTLKNNSNITPELLEIIERYHNRSMTQEEHVRFEKQLHNDAAFKIVVEDIRVTLLGIETQALKEQLDKFHEDIPQNSENLIEKSTVKVHFLSFTKIAIAAGIIITLGLFWIFSGSTNTKLYSKYFTPDPGLPTTMSASSNFEFYDAMVNYKQGDYATAISKWRKLEQKAPDNDTINYFLGVALLADKNAEDAVSYLIKTTNNTESVFLEEAYYYLGLAYLKSDNVNDARKAFQKSQSKKSQEILKRLN